MAIFTDVFEDVTKQGRKIPTSDYHETGIYPIIDQGQSEIAGFTDETDGLFTDVPAIIFGDHTRVLKYVDTPCFLGADGVKLLKARIPNPNYKYLYYALSSADIPNTGYNRHFKWLKAVDIPLLDADEQQTIVDVLDKISELITLRKEQLAKLDQLVKSRFIELFGDLHSTNFPKCKMADVCGIKHGYAFSGEFFTEVDNNILLVTPGNFKVGGGFQEKKCKFFTGEYSKEYVLNGGDLIVTMTDLSKNMDTLGYSAIVPHTDRVYLHNQRIGLFVNVSVKINRVFLMHFMQTNEYRDNIIASATGSTVHHTSPSKILDCEMFVPPIELQNQFVAFVEQTDKSKLAVQASLDKLELLKKSLMQEYFG